MVRFAGSGAAAVTGTGRICGLFYRIAVRPASTESLDKFGFVVYYKPASREWREPIPIGNASVAQSVEQLIRNQQVVCSSHITSSKKARKLLKQAVFGLFYLQEVVGKCGTKS